VLTLLVIVAAPVLAVEVVVVEVVVVDASAWSLLLGDNVDAVDDAGDVSTQLEQQRDQDLAAQALLQGDRHRR